MKNNTHNKNSRKTFLDTISNKDFFPVHVTVSAIQGLYHVSEKGDEKYLIPLLDCDNKKIAGVTLSTLYTNFHLGEQLKDRIVCFASHYLKEDEDNDLQTNAIIALADMSLTDTTMLKKLIEIGEKYFEIVPETNAACTNALVWKLLANHTGKKIDGEAINELVWNTHSERSEEIRCQIRKNIILKLK